VTSVRAGVRRLVRPLAAPDTALLPKILAAFVAVLALASLVTLLLETRLTRQQLETQAVSLVGESGDVLDARISADAVRTSQLMSIVSQGLFGASRVQVPVDDVDDLASRTLSIVRTSDNQLDLVGVVNVATGETSSLGLPTRDELAPPDPDTVAEVARSSGASQRVVPLLGGGYAVVYVLPVARLDPEPRLLVTGYALNTATARRLLEQTGVDAVELVVDGEVVATSSGDGDSVGGTAVGDWDLTRATQQLEDGRLARYVALGSDRPWDAPTAIGLISDDPLAALDGGLAQTRMLMVLLLVVVGGSLAFALARVMTRPILHLTRTATAIADGELDRPFDVDRRDEIGRLGDALERMRRALRAQLLVIRRQAEALQEAARRIVGVQDTERQRIAQDLHDGIQQQLVVLRMQVGVATARLQDQPERAEEVGRELAASIDALLDQLRSTGQDLFPSILRDRGLGPALFSLAGRVAVPVDVELEPSDLPRSDPQVEVNAYFLLSEAILNALKHADARRVGIEIVHEGDVLRVTARDDGVGFDPSGPGHRGGLVHMRDRVNAMGGSLQLVSRPGEGTRVTAVFPLTREAGSVGRSLEVEQHGGDPAVEVDLLGETELPEDGVRVLLDRSVGDGELPGDGRVPSS
jgi:signal transduction histidine kinase